MKYYEPFIGGGAVFFNLQPHPAVISDLNPRVIKVYEAVKYCPEDVIVELHRCRENHSKEYFQHVLQRYNENDFMHLAESAALFIYLIYRCFFGIYRENAEGKITATFGGFDPTKEGEVLLEFKVHETRIRACSQVLQNTDIRNCSFEETKIEEGAFYYFDPPYHELSQGYSKDSFNEDDQSRLAKMCHAIHHAGGYFILSNSNTDFIKNLYVDYSIENIFIKYAISAHHIQTDEVKRSKEVLISNIY